MSEDGLFVDHNPPSPLQRSVQLSDGGGHQTQVFQDEIRQQFHWLADVLDQNQREDWGTAYRDFIDVVLLLNAVQGLGMVEQRNSRISDGVFHASTGDVQLDLPTFLNVMNLGQAIGTWQNKLPPYFRIKTLHSFFQYNGKITFQEIAHTQAWNVVRVWMDNQHQVLAGGHWITTRYGNTELRPLLRSMVQEVQQGKHLFCSYCRNTKLHVWKVV